MKTFLKNLALCAVVGTTISANAVNFGVDPNATWFGFMNVWDIPQNGPGGSYPPTLGAYMFGSGWGTADLCATWSSGVLTLSPNTIGDPAEYWYIGGGMQGAIGNKIMDANLYLETTGLYSGQTVSFSGTVSANTLVGQTDALGNGWTSVAFIKDFAPDYSSFNVATVPLTPGAFSVSLGTVADPARHVQWGFETLGPDVWITDVGNFGNIQIVAVPEPSSLALMGLGLLGTLVWRRRQ